MNKQITLFLLAFVFLLNLPGRATAQADFAPIGATWYHAWANYNVGFPGNNLEGIVLQESVSDTVINNITTRKLRRTSFSHNAQNALVSTPLSNIYVYATEDTVFSYDVDSNRFVPLYVFNVAVGDTMTHHSIGAPAPPGFVTTWKTVVDSIGYPVYNGKPIKKIFHHEVYPSPGQRQPPYFQYMGQLMGDWNTYFVAIHIPEDSYRTNGLRCYQDDTLNVHFTDINIVPCDSVPPGPNSISDVDFLSRRLSVYPNPATDQVTIALDGIAMQSVEVLDMLGRRVFVQEYKAGISKATADLSNVSKGTYILRINTKDKGSVHHKIVLK
ncbi:hypothetical protein D3C71_193570 [compost metagenome]